MQGSLDEDVGKSDVYSILTGDAHALHKHWTRGQQAFVFVAQPLLGAFGIVFAGCDVGACGRDGRRELARIAELHNLGVGTHWSERDDELRQGWRVEQPRQERDHDILVH